MKINKSVITWILQVLLSSGFLLASSGKLSNNPQIIEMFENWGYPKNFHFLIGILELSLAVLLLIPKTLKIAIFGITIILIGAMTTHLNHDPIQEVIRPIIFLVILGSIYFIHFSIPKL